MTIDEFVAALSGLRERYVWYVDDLGALRAFLPPPVSAEHSPMTALAYAQTEKEWDYTADWERAALALGLTPHDAARIVSAEDQDSRAEAWLVRDLRVAVGAAQGPGLAVPQSVQP